MRRSRVTSTGKNSSAFQTEINANSLGGEIAETGGRGQPVCRIQAHYFGGSEVLGDTPHGDLQSKGDRCRASLQPVPAVHTVETKKRRPRKGGAWVATVDPSQSPAPAQQAKQPKAAEKGCGGLGHNDTDDIIKGRAEADFVI